MRRKLGPPVTVFETSGVILRTKFVVEDSYRTAGQQIGRWAEEYRFKEFRQAT